MELGLNDESSLAREFSEITEIGRTASVINSSVIIFFRGGSFASSVMLFFPDNEINEQ